MSYYSRKFRYVRNTQCGTRKKVVVDISLDMEELSSLIRLLEFAESEIQRTFKRFSPEDMDLKEIYYYYRLSGRKLRRRLKEVRGF